jgi:hypothetical protein
MTVKKQIKDWHNAVSSRKNQEWLILHLVKGETPAQSGGKLFQLKGSVLDKLRTDFNQDKRDRCFVSRMILHLSLTATSADASKSPGLQQTIALWHGESLETK